MDPKSLFQDPLTYPSHETRDIHYIGESIPTPSQVTEVAPSNVASVGGSAVVAREDHVHNIDLSDYYTETEIDALLDDVIAGELDLSGYYTKVEADARYYTQSAVDALFAALDYYTTSEVDALIAAITVPPAPLIWTYSGIVAPTVDTELGEDIAQEDYDVERIVLSVTDADPTNDIDVDILVAGALEDTVTLGSNTVAIEDDTVSFSVTDGQAVTCRVAENVTGVATNLVIKLIRS